MTRISVNFVTYSLVFVKKTTSFISFNHGFHNNEIIMVLTQYQIVKFVLYAPMRLSTLQRVGDSLGETTLFGKPVSKLTETPISTSQ